MNNTDLSIKSFFDVFKTTLQTKVYTENKVEHFLITYQNEVIPSPLKFCEFGFGKSAVNFLYDKNFDLFTQLLLEDSESIVKQIKSNPERNETWLPFFNLAYEILNNNQIHPYYFPLLEAIVNAYKRNMRNALGESLGDDYFKQIGQSYVVLKKNLTKLMGIFDTEQTAQAVIKRISETEPHFFLHTLMGSTEFITTDPKQENTTHQLHAILYPQVPEDFFYYLAPTFLESNLRIKRCENCMRYFVITNQSNARFCEHIYEESGRTCRQLMPKINLMVKSKQDPAEWLYNRAYKTMYSRVTSGTITKDAYKAWSKAARAKRSECSKGLLTPEEYSSWLCDNGLFIDYLKEN